MKIDFPIAKWKRIADLCGVGVEMLEYRDQATSVDYMAEECLRKAITQAVNSSDTKTPTISSLADLV